MAARRSTRARPASCSRTSWSARCTTRSSSGPRAARRGLRLLLQAGPAHRRRRRAAEEPARRSASSVYRLDTPVDVNGYHQSATSGSGTPQRRRRRCPPGRCTSRWRSRMKHWIQAVLGEDPFIPYNYYYDVVDWSYSLQRGLAGDGWLTTPIPPAHDDDARSARRRPRLGAAGAAPGLRVQHGLGAAAWPWRPTCSTRASPSTARGRRSTPAASTSTRAPRSWTVRRWPTAASTWPRWRPSGRRRSPACTATRSPASR